MFSATGHSGVQRLLDAACLTVAAEAPQMLGEAQTEPSAMSAMSVEVQIEPSPISAEAQIEPSQIPEETQTEPSQTSVEEQTKPSQMSAEERVETFELPVEARIELFKTSPPQWAELYDLYQSIPSFHSTIVGIQTSFRFPDSCQPRYRRRQCITYHWCHLSTEFTKPLPKTKEVDRLRNYHGHFILNILRLRLLSDNLKRVENGGDLQFEVGSSEMGWMFVPGNTETGSTKEEFVKFCVDSAKVAWQEMAVLLPRIYHTTEKVKEEVARAAYREEQRREAEEIAEIYDRACIEGTHPLHPSILSLECPVPESYQVHFTHDQNARGVYRHWIDFRFNTPECLHLDDRATRDCWAAYQACEASIEKQKDNLFAYSDTMFECEDPRLFLYGANDEMGPPAAGVTKETIHEECLKQAREILAQIITLLPALREASQAQIRQHRSASTNLSKITSPNGTVRDPA